MKRPSTAFKKIINKIILFCSFCLGLIYSQTNAALIIDIGTRLDDIRISADGSVVTGNVWNNSSSAFRWTANAGLENLGSLPGMSGARASGVNADGSVVVGLSGGNTFRWSPTAGMEEMGLNPSGSSSVVVNSVSGDGSIVVGRNFPNAGPATAFRWSSSGGLLDLGGLGSRANSSASSVSLDGTKIVGQAFPNAIGMDSRAWLWTSTGGMQDLGLLPGASTASAEFISGDGSTVVGVANIGFGNQTFRWTTESGMQGLLYHGTEVSSSNPSGINGDGSVIIGNSFGSQLGAFIWTQNEGVQNFQEFLVSKGVVS